MRMRNLLILYMLALVGGTAILFTGVFHGLFTRKMLEGIDARLFAAAHFARESLPTDFHDSLTGPESLAPAEYERLVDRNNRLCTRLGLQYLWSCVVTDGKIVFTTATSPGKDVSKGDHAGFFAVHHDPEAFARVFRTMEPDYSEFRNEWGRGRQVLVPFRDRQGRAYCFGASMSVDDVYASLRSLLITRIAIGLLILALGFAGAVFLARLVSRPIAQLTESAGRIATGEMDHEVTATGPAEVDQLAGALNTMRLSIRDKMEALRRSEGMIATILHSVPQGIFWKDTDFKYLGCNALFARETGMATPADIVGKTDYDLPWSREAADGYRADDLRVIKSRQTKSHIVETLKRADGQNRWIDTTKVPLFNQDGSVYGVLGVYSDVTERTHAAEVRERLEEQLRQAQKMEAVGQLAGGVAHDFNNMLQAIGGYTDLALSDLAADHPVRSWLEESALATRRAATLVGQLLAFSRRQIMKPEDLDLNELVGGFQRMLARMIGELIRVEFIPGHSLGTVHADRGMIEQVLMNLCVNARDAMPKGGRLTIETENVFFDAAYCETNLWARPGRYVLLSVTDTGCGMDAATLARIYEPFFTTKDVGKGTGLGLPVVYGILRQHEGMIRTYSEPDKGSTFKVYLPAVERPVQSVGTKIAGPAPGGKETILLAEDDTEVRNLAQQILERAGYTVRAAPDGVAAVRLFDTHIDRIDLLLLDVVMPGLGGREVFDHARRIRPTLPSLFASGYSENAIHTNFVLQEGMRLIQKPYRADELLRRVRETLDARGH